jgi:uncharacterized phage-associated protein
MNKIQFTFNPQKSTQALNFFAIKQGGQVNKMKALKLIFLADRYHLRKYGRLITNDTYVAMKHGPVPSTTRDIAEFNDYLDEAEKHYSSHYVESDNLKLKSKKKIDVTVFSESDLEALNFVWDNFGHYDQFQLRDITHSYPEWKKHSNTLNHGSCINMNILDFLKDPDELVDKSLDLDKKVHKTFELSDEDREFRHEDLEERALIESLWR